MTVLHFRLFLLVALAIVVKACDNFDNSSESIINRFHYEYQVVDDNVVYDAKTHAAFTSLIKFHGALFVAFREGETHRPSSVSNYGKIVILKREGIRWEKVGTISEPDMDLLDPFFVEYKGKLLMYCGFNCFNAGGSYVHGGSVMYECDVAGGFHHSEAKRLEHDFPYYLWLWKVRVNGNTMFSIGYNEEHPSVFLSSNDGIRWDGLAEIDISGTPTEADMNFDNDTLFCVIRRDTPVGSNSYWGMAVPPYNNISWKEICSSIACPELFRPDDACNFLLAGREYLLGRKNVPDSISVSLFDVSRNRRINKFYTFDTGRLGDKGYPSIIQENDSILCSYYEGEATCSRIHVVTLSINKQKN